MSVKARGLVGARGPSPRGVFIPTEQFDRSLGLVAGVGFWLLRGFRCSAAQLSPVVRWQRAELHWLRASHLPSVSNAISLRIMKGNIPVLLQIVFSYKQPIKVPEFLQSHYYFSWKILILVVF